MKILVSLVAASALLLASCSSLIVTPEDCLLAPITKPGAAYQIALGPCLNDTILGQATTPEGVKLQASFSKKTGEWTLRYQAPDGTWVVYDSKSGLLDFGPLLDAVNAAQ
ncbi:MAG: hypothetical protein WC718_00155 [Phycisphaerales bacterium]|jgi:hypothetical protein